MTPPTRLARTAALSSFRSGCKRRWASWLAPRRKGLLALSVGVGLGVLAELMEAEVDDVVGPKGKHDPDRAAVRHGHEGGEVTLGGRRVPVGRPRVRAAGGSGEVPLTTYGPLRRPRPVDSRRYLSWS